MPSLSRIVKRSRVLQPSPWCSTRFSVASRGTKDRAASVRSSEPGPGRTRLRRNATGTAAEIDGNGVQKLASSLNAQTWAAGSYEGFSENMGASRSVGGESRMGAHSVRSGAFLLPAGTRGRRRACSRPPSPQLTRRETPSGKRRLRCSEAPVKGSRSSQGYRRLYGDMYTLWRQLRCLGEPLTT
jgi:hypothetical protein